MNRYNLYFRATYLLSDVLLLAFSFWLVYWVKLFSIEPWSFSFILGAFTIISWLVIVLTFSLNDPRRDESADYHLLKFIGGQVLFALAVALFILFLKQNTSRLFLGIFFITEFFSLGLNRLLWLRLSRSIRLSGYNLRNVFLYGSPVEYDLLKKWMDQNKSHGYHLNGWFHRQKADDGWQHLGAAFDSISKDGSVDHFVFDPTQISQQQLETAVDWAEDKGARIHLIEPRTEVISSRLLARDRFGPFAAVRLRVEPLSNSAKRIIKRLYDIVFSTLVLVLFYWWFYCLAGLLIKLSSRGPIIIRQKRIGIDGIEFLCLKFRTMVSDRSAEKGYSHLTLKDDHRITLIGKILRKSNLDEVPQFFNVLKGNMSVVGPRPHMVSEERQIADKIKKYRIRRFVKPGITGWAAIHSFRGGTENMDLMQKRVDYDLDYIENWTMLMDLKISAITAYQMITFRTGAR